MLRHIQGSDRGGVLLKNSVYSGASHMLDGAPTPPIEAQTTPSNIPLQKFPGNGKDIGFHGSRHGRSSTRYLGLVLGHRR